MDTQASKDEYDAIIVGSGPAGATIARELSRTNKRVLILERGGDAPLKEGLGMASILNPVLVNEDLVTVRAFTTGGTTAVYFAVADTPPLDVYRSLGIELSDALEEAKKDLPLAVLPDHLLSAAALRVRESAEALGYPCHRSTMMVDLAKCAAGYTYEAKWNARIFLREAVEKGATLVTRARVLKVLVDQDRAIGVEYKVQTGKKAFDVRRAFGAKIILAAGGAASPIILRDSGIRSIATSGFYCDPSVVVAGTIRGLKAGDNFVGSLGTIIDGDISVGDGNPARVFYRMLMLSNGQWIRAFRHSSSLAVGVMINDSVDGELRENGGYHKSLKSEELKKLAKGEEVARRIIQHAGGKNIVRLKPSASHIGGSVGIGKHVDQHLKTEYDNLYVCDGSVIPETARVSPTFTLICLGKYLASHLARTL